MAADGSIVIKVDVDSKEAQKELTSLTKEITKTEEIIEETQKKKEEASSTSLIKGAELDREKAKLQEIEDKLKEIRLISKDTSLGAGTREEVKSQIPDIKTELAEQKARVRLLQAEYDKVSGSVERYDEKLTQANATLEKQRTRAGELTEQITNANSASAQMARAVDRAGAHMDKFLNRVRQLAVDAFAFTIISRALSGMRDWLVKVVKSNSEATAAIAKLKAALLTLAQPLVNVIIPAFTKIVNVLTKIIYLVSEFVSMLFGTTVEESADAAEKLYDEANAVESVGDAAEEATEALAGFDEINRLSSEGIDSSGVDIPADGIIPDFKENPVGELPIDLRLAIEDVFFDGEMNGEKIAERVIAVLSAACGAATGFTLGGVPGALVGSLLGLMLGVYIDSMMFNHDGKISKDEVVKMVASVLTSIIGGIIGWKVTHSAKGIIIGATVGLTLTAMLQSVTASGKKSYWSEEIQSLVDEIAETEEFILDMRVRLNSITGEVDPEKMADLNLAQKLVDEIFDIDAADNKTAEQIDILKTKIEQLNGLNLNGVQLTFDETTGHVVQTRGEVVKLLETIKKQYQMEALREAYVEAYRAQYDIQRELIEANKTYQGVLEEIAAQEEEYQKAKEEYRNVEYNFWDDLTGKYGLQKSERLAAYLLEEAKLKDLQTELENAQNRINELGEQSTEAEDKLKFFDSALMELNSNMSEFADDATKKMTEAGKNVVTAMVDGINKEKSKLSKTVEGLSDIVSKGVKTVSSILGNKFSSLKTSTYAMPTEVASIRSVPIPQLARGAVIPPNREFMAVLGDQKSGTNIEAPEALIRKIVREESGTNTELLQAILEAIRSGHVIMVDGAVFGQTAIRAINTANTKAGKQLLRI